MELNTLTWCRVNVVIIITITKIITVTPICRSDRCVRIHGQYPKQIASNFTIYMVHSQYIVPKRLNYVQLL